MKKESNTLFAAAILVVACWFCLSTICITPCHAQADDIKYTIYGASLSAVVSGADFTILTQNLGDDFMAWDLGDFDETGMSADASVLVGTLTTPAATADTSDRLLITDDPGDVLRNYLVSEYPEGSWTSTSAAPSSQILTNIPEPASLGLLAVSTFGILSQRRSRCRR